MELFITIRRWFTVGFLGFFKRLFCKEVGVYLVLVKKEDKQIPVTFTTTYAEACRAVARSQYFDAFSYYAASCLDTGEAIGFEEPSWQRYIKEHPRALRQYYIKYIWYPATQLASFLRQLLGEEPLYLPYESPAEIMRYFLQNRTENNGEIVCSPRTEEVSEYDAAYRRQIAAALLAAVAQIPSDPPASDKSK